MGKVRNGRIANNLSDSAGRVGRYPFQIIQVALKESNVRQELLGRYTPLQPLRLDKERSQAARSLRESVAHAGPAM